MIPFLKNYVKNLTPKIQRLTHISARLNRSWLPIAQFLELLSLFKNIFRVSEVVPSSFSRFFISI